jgi:CHAT domain-containing protein
MRLRSLRLTVLPLLLLGLAACQDDATRPALSVEQARAVQASFSGQAATSFVPPPRSVLDVTALLASHAPDQARIDTLRRAAEAQPPAGADATTLYWFYNDRGHAAGQLGLVRQQLDDLREAVRIGTEARLNTFRGLLNLLSAEAFAGNNRRAAEIATHRVEVARAGGQYGQMINALAIQGSQLLALGDAAGALRAVDEADAILRRPEITRWPGYTTLLPDWQLQIARARGEIALASGRYVEAEQWMRTALAHTERARATIDAIRSLVPDIVPDTYDRLRLVPASRTGRALLLQGRTAEAEIEFRRVLVDSLGLAGRSSPFTAASTLQLAAALSAQGRDADAQLLAETALAIYRELGIGRGSRFVATAHVTLAQTLTTRRDYDAALRAIAAARDVFADDADERFRHVESEPVYVVAHLAAGRASDIVAVAERVATARAQRLGANHYDSAEARGLFAAALARTGRRDAALGEFRAAMPILLSPSRRSEDDDGGGMRNATARTILEAYLELLSTLPATNPGGLDPAAESFRIADALRAGGVQRALAASAARTAIPDPDLAALVRQEQDARKQIAAQYALLATALSSPTDQQDPAATQALRVQIDRLRDARAALRGEIERRFPDYAQLIDPRPASVAEAQAQLRPGEALLAIHVGESASYVWAVPHGGAVRFAAVPLGESETARLVARLRAALDPQAATLGDIPAFDVATAHLLHTRFVAPVTSALAGIDNLLVVADKSLAQLPLALLVTRPAETPRDAAGQALFSGYARIPFLVRDMAVTQLPTVAALGTLRRLPPGDPSRRPFIGFGDPVFSPQQAQGIGATQVAALDQRAVASRGVRLERRAAPQTRAAASADLARLPRLADTAEELTSVARALRADPERDVFLGAAANERQVKTLDLARRRVVMFATHGLVPGDLDGLLQPALALSAPGVAGVEGDGLLTLEEILGLRLNADWVVLSACNTAAADGAGAEAISGLGRAFFYAGTRALLVSNWPVETRSARLLTTELFRRQAEDPRLGRAEAMRRAMLALIDGPGAVEGGRTIFSYAHPIFWAPFSVVGDPGS